MLTVPPVTKPPRLAPTNQKSNRLYTIHEKFNNALALRAVRDTDKTAMIAFRQYNDVVTMAHMLESHYKTYREWPDLLMDTSIKIYTGPNDSIDPAKLDILTVTEWSPDEINMIAAASYMDILQIEKLVQTSKGYNIKGSRLVLTGTHDFYIAVCKKLLLNNIEDE
jgi:hypothetical protein